MCAYFLLRYIYTGELNLKTQSEVDIFGLLIASDELHLEELVNYLQEYLINQQTIWVQQNFILILNTIFDLPNYEKLRDHCTKSIFADPVSFFSSQDFLSLDKEVLCFLLKQDNSINEIIVWDCLVQWGINQIPELVDKNSSCREKWTKKNYEDLKNVLSKFIPLVKFTKITSDDFYDKVRPYEAIIPKNIYEKVMAYYLVEQPKLRKYITTIRSNIIGPKLANIIANWIDKKDSTFIRTEDDPMYKFDPIYRGSRDGINNKSFKKKCKGQVASLVLIKVQHSDKIFGGYSSIGFNSIGDSFKVYDGFQFYYASDNFIFSFEDSEDTQNVRISRVRNNFKAIMVRKSGFNFGWGSLCMINQNLHVNNKSDSYENNLNTETVYAIEDIETFIVVKS